MKRHPSLIPLSQDHHHGLALALRLRQGDSALLNDGWTHDRNAQAKMVNEFFVKELRPHFQAEEEVIFPAISKYVAGSLDMVSQLLNEHREIERIVAEIGRTQGSKLDDNLVGFGTLLEKHIRIEERGLFELIQAQIPAAILEDLGREVRRIHDSD